VSQVLGALHTSAASWHTDTVSCPGGRIVTVDALSAVTDPTNLPARLAGVPPADATRFGSPGNRLAWIEGSASVVVAASDDGTHITVQRTERSC
jgi:hypothetical protein